MSTDTAQTFGPGDIVSYNGQVGILRPAPAKTHGMTVPAAWLGFHRYVATRDDFAKTHTTILDPDHLARAAVADDPRRGGSC